MKDKREHYLGVWLDRVTQLAYGGHLTKDPIGFSGLEMIAGPRAGVLRLVAAGPATATSQLVKALSRGDCADLRPLLPWDPPDGCVSAYLHGRYIRCEAAWPKTLQETHVPLSRLGQYPASGGKWIAGKTEFGKTATLTMDDITPHYLAAGTTGAGKSFAVTVAAYQLGQCPDNQLVLIDGKGGADLRHLSRLPRLVGPLAGTLEDARAALSWAVDAMRQREQVRRAGDRVDGRVVVFFDEPQLWLNADQAISDMTTALVTQGRSAGVHLMFTMQHPNVDSFGPNGPTIKRLLDGRIALRVTDQDTSRLLLDNSDARCDRLLGAGDAILRTARGMQRAQLAFVTDRELGRLDGAPALETWPEFVPEKAAAAVGGDWPEPIEVAVALRHAAEYSDGKHRGGVPGMRKALEEATGREGGQGRGTTRLRRLRDWGREIWDVMEGWEK